MNNGLHCFHPYDKIHLPNMLQDYHLCRNQQTSRTTWPGEPSDALLITSLSANSCFWRFRLTNCHVQCSIIRKRCNGYCQKQLGWKIECSRKQKDLHTLCTDTNVDKHKHTTCILQYGCWTPMRISWVSGRWLRCSSLSWSCLSIRYLFHTGDKMTQGNRERTVKLHLFLTRTILELLCCESQDTSMDMSRSWSTMIVGCRCSQLQCHKW